MKTRRLWRGLVLATTTYALLAASACAGNGNGDGAGDEGLDAGGGDDPSPAAPSAETEAIFDEADGYAGWPSYPEDDERVFSQSHEESYVRTYYNDAADQAIDEQASALPEGALLVKENYPSQEAEEPAALTLMRKRQDGWYWIKATSDWRVLRSPAGEPLEGEVQGCISCHSSVSDNDMVFTFELGP